MFAASHRIDTLEKKRKDVAIAPLAELLPRLGGAIWAAEAPGLRFGETWVEFRGAQRTLYMGDAATNLATVPWFPLGWLLRPLGFGPGLRINALRRRFLVLEPGAHWEFVEHALATPTRVVPGHGDVIDEVDVARLRTLMPSPPSLDNRPE